MKPENYSNIKEEDKEVFILYRPDGTEIEGEFYYGRINRDTLPEGIYAYDLRDDTEDIVSLENVVTVNFAGTFLSPKKIEIPEEGYIDLSEDEEGCWGWTFM